MPVIASSQAGSSLALLLSPAGPRMQEDRLASNVHFACHYVATSEDVDDDVMANWLQHMHAGSHTRR